MAKISGNQGANRESGAHPHDRIVKKLLSNVATAKDILSIYLPKDVLKIVDLNNLTLQRDSFIDDEHRAFAVDLLYKTTFQKEEGYIWILLEHQSSDDPWLPVRLFKYIGLIWEHFRKTSKKKTLPLIYPIVLYNGQRPYASNLTLKDMIEPESSRKIFSTLFQSPFCLIDLAKINDETLRKQAQNHVRGIALLMTLKHIFDKNLQTFFEQVLMLEFKRMDRAGDRDDVADMLYYLLNKGEFLNEEKCWRILNEEFSHEVGEKVMTITQKLEARAEARGAQKELEKVAKRLLEEGLELSFIAKTTKLPLTKIKELQKKAKH